MRTNTDASPNLISHWGGWVRGEERANEQSCVKTGSSDVGERSVLYQFPGEAYRRDIAHQEDIKSPPAPYEDPNLRKYEREHEKYGHIRLSE
ncbi:hypothetical protein Q9L58_002957 [Maublancomyces gigas]|uniref:Uncharacterized protein n=1 Tax=Discina gigas TaxID=1032678 RepID=A0ABR3GR03_9PEZI